VEDLMRSVLLSLAKNRSLNNAAKKYGLRFGAGRFVAGSNLDEALQQIRRLNQEGIVAVMDHLGEFISSKEEALEATETCIETLDGIARAGVNSHLSVKMTQLGMDLDKEFCLANMERILTRAKEHNNFVRIDIEDSPRTQITVDIFRELRRKFDNVGLVLQSYLYRTEKDLLDLRANLRLVKGAYKEPKEVAFPSKADVDKNLNHLIELQMRNGDYVGIASHDIKIINHAKEFATSNKISRDKFEFQMLYGICTDLQKKLVEEGYKVRVYVPYGTDWYGYYMRRMAERPANVAFILKNLFK
jgi:proline dehydrogenase